MLKDYKYFMDHYNDYEDKVNELIKDVTDFVKEDIKNKKYSALSREKLYNHMSVDTVLYCVLDDDWENYDDPNELLEIYNHLLTMFAKSVENRLKSKGYDVDTIMEEIKGDVYE